MPQTWDEKGNVVQPSAMQPAVMPPGTPPPAAPTAKQKQTWDEHGKPVEAKSPLTVEKAMPFSSGVAQGAMLDPTKIAEKKTTLGQMGEVGKQFATGGFEFLKSVAKDPLNVGNPIDEMVKGQKDAYKDIHEGFTKNNHDQLMHGLGLAVGNMALIMGGAKSAKEGMGVGAAAKEVGFAAKDLSAKRAIVGAASHSMLDELRKTQVDNTVRDASGKPVDLSKLGVATKAERARIGGNVNSINISDTATNPKGYVPVKIVLGTVDQAISDKKAGVLLQKKMLPKVAQIRGLVEGHGGGNMTFDNLKQVRSIIGRLIPKSQGIESSILGDLYSSFTDSMKNRAARLGKIKEFNEYVEATDKLDNHEKGLIKTLQGTKTGFDYYKFISDGTNKPNLNRLVTDLHLPSDFFHKTTKDYNKIHYYANLSKGDSLVARLTNRLIAMKGHPIVGTLGGVTGLELGRTIGGALGSPMIGSFAGFTFGAALAHDFISKYEAAQAIRELGGPSGVMGTPRTRPPASQPQNPNQSSPGPGGPSGAAPTALAPKGGVPPTPVKPSGLSPALARLLPEARAEISEKAKETAHEALHHHEAPGEEEGFSTEKGIKEGYEKESNKPIDRRQRVELRKAIDKLKDSPNDALKHFQRALEQARKSEPTKVLEGITNKAKESQAKFESEARGRQVSKRPGMTKDTPEARKAKASARIASRRASGELGTSTSGGNVVEKAEAIREQARALSGRVTPESLRGISIVDIEDAAKELDHTPSRMIYRGLQGLRKSQKWSDEVYRGYLEDFILKSIDEKSKGPNIPGLDAPPKKIE